MRGVENLAINPHMHTRLQQYVKRLVRNLRRLSRE